MLCSSMFLILIQELTHFILTTGPRFDIFQYSNILELHKRSQACAPPSKYTRAYAQIQAIVTRASQERDSHLSNGARESPENSKVQELTWQDILWYNACEMPCSLISPLNTDE